MTELSIRSWKRYGYDRAYLNDADGNDLGFIDLTTGEVTAKPGADADVVRDALLAWAVAEEEDPTPGDLALNKPGAAVRAKAQQEWDEYHARRPVASTIARAFGRATPDQSWTRGAEGEEAVGARLAQLESAGWRTLHSIPVGTRGSDIDHLLIGPGGVFTINTKNHSRASVWVGERMIMVNGKKTDHLRNARFEGERVSKVLTRATPWSVPAVPVLVILAEKLTIKRLPDDVRVVRRRDVPSYFRRLPWIYSDEAVAAIYDAARKTSTWA